MHVITEFIPFKCLKSCLDAAGGGWVGVGRETLLKGDQCDGLNFNRATFVLKQMCELGKTDQLGR